MLAKATTNDVSASSKRHVVLAGIVGAGLFCIGWVYIGLASWPEAVIANDTVMDRLGYALICEVFVGLMLLSGVGAVAHQRFFSNTNIDGSVPVAGTSLDINKRYLQNTQEQVLLAVIAHLALALVVPVSSLNIIPVLVALFVLARICFWFGYHISPQARAFGFATTLHPIVAVYLYLFWRIVFTDI